MPTSRPRTNITHTPQVRHALEVARAHWPDEDRDSVLLLKLLDAGVKTIEAGEDAAAERRIARIRQLAGAHTELYGPGYLDEVRDGWGE